MARRHERQRRLRRRLLVLGLLAAAGASAFWMRSATGRFPWAAHHDSGGDTSIALMGTRNAPDDSGSAAPPASPPSSQPAAGSPADPPPRPTTATDKPAGVRPSLPTTLPSVNRPVRPDSAKASSDLKAGMDAMSRGDMVAARQFFTQAYANGLNSTDDQQARDKLAEIASQTLFSSKQFKGDPLADFITVQAGDTLNRIANRYHVSEDFLATINNLTNKNLVRQGRRLKVVRGPWHVVVSKSRHMLDLYVQDKHVRSFRVALGIEGSTPTGVWRVANHQEDPGWTDPRSGRRWHPSDPSNPIGEYWIGIEGVDGEAVGQFGYGIHGTNEPETIGKDVSMGCVRMAPDDIALVYKLLVPGQSYVLITD